MKLIEPNGKVSPPRDLPGTARHLAELHRRGVTGVRVVGGLTADRPPTEWEHRRLMELAVRYLQETDPAPGETAAVAEKSAWIAETLGRMPRATEGAA